MAEISPSFVVVHRRFDMQRGMGRLNHNEHQVKEKIVGQMHHEKQRVIIVQLVKISQATGEIPGQMHYEKQGLIIVQLLMAWVSAV